MGKPDGDILLSDALTVTELNLSPEEPVPGEPYGRVHAARRADEPYDALYQPVGGRRPFPACGNLSKPYGQEL